MPGPVFATESWIEDEVYGDLGTPPIPGWYHPNPVSTDTGSLSSAEGSLYVVPLWVPGSMSVTEIGVEVAVAGGAGSVIRLGIYDSTSATNGRPGALIVDAGTVDATSIGVKTAAISETLSGLVWLAAVTQGGGSPTVQIYRVQGANRVYPRGFAAGTFRATSGAVRMGATGSVTGALPSTGSFTAVTTTGPFLGVRHT